MKNAAKIQKALIPAAILNVLFFISWGLGDVVQAVCFIAMIGLYVWSGAIRYALKWIFMPFYRFKLLGAIILFIFWWPISALTFIFLPLGYMLYARYRVTKGE